MLPSLPGPGTSAFVRLCKELKRFGLVAEKVTVETPTTKLSDVRATASLLQDTVSLRLYYEWFELFVPVLIQGQGESLLEVAGIVMSALATMDEGVTNGHLFVQSFAHLRLESGDPDIYLQEYLTGSAPFQAEAFAFTVQAPGESIREGRIVVALSALFDASLFVDYWAEYPNPRFTAELLKKIRADYATRLSLLGLEATHP